MACVVSLLLKGVREYKIFNENGMPLIKRKGGKHHMEHRDIETMREREIKIENVFLRAYIDELLKDVPEAKKSTLYTSWY